jgi:hypothetical protein
VTGGKIEDYDSTVEILRHNIGCVNHMHARKIQRTHIRCDLSIYRYHIERAALSRRKGRNPQAAIFLSQAITCAARRQPNSARRILSTAFSARNTILNSA